MMKTILAVAALALASTSVFAAPQTPGTATEFSAAKKAKHQRHARYVSQPKIACTFYGCHPVPRGCTPTTGYDFWGNPTDYDDVVCR